MNNDMQVVGITGGIASGKSLVSTRIEKLGYKVIDTDVIAKTVVDSNIEGVLDKIVNNFGKGVLLEPEKHDVQKNHKKKYILDRKKLAKIIYGDNDSRQKLNAIMHPVIKKELDKKIELLKHEGYTKKIIFVIVPLLYEAGFETNVETVIAVITREDIQLARLKKRDDINEEYAQKKINAQLPMQEKAHRADYIIDNSKGKKETYQQLQHIIFNLEKKML